MTPSGPIALSCGEPAGIGPEIAVKAWDELARQLPVLLDRRPAPPAGRHAASPRKSRAPAEAVEASTDSIFRCCPSPSAAVLAKGTADPANAAGVIQSIETAVRLVQAGEASAVCTAPIHKKALIDGAGFTYPRPYRIPGRARRAGPAL